MIPDAVRADLTITSGKPGGALALAEALTAISFDVEKYFNYHSHFKKKFYNLQTPSKTPLMKKNYLLTATLLLFASLIFTTCKKDPTKNAKLPPATQEGKNTVGFTIDGEVWVPYYKCRFMGNPCGEILARYGESGGAVPKGIDFGFNRERKGEFSGLSISSSGSGTVTSLGNKIDSISVEYQGENWSGNTGIYRGPINGHDNKFVITKFDYPNQIVSGEFQFTLIEQNGSGDLITIKDGRFDFKFNACKCSN